MTNIAEIKNRIHQLKIEHRDLDDAIQHLMATGHKDELQLQRLKKRKLQLKDYIHLLEMQLLPDIPA